MPDNLVAKRTITSSMSAKCEEILTLCDAYGDASGCYVRCIDADGEYLTDFPGTESAENFFNEHCDAEVATLALSAFVNNGLEDVVELTTNQPYVMARSLAIRGEANEIIGAWLVMGVDDELIPEDVYVPSDIRRISQKQLENSLSFIQLLTIKLVKILTKNSSLSTELKNISNREVEMAHRLERNEVMTEILRMMEMDNSFAKIAEDMLAEAGRYLGITNALVMQLSSDEKTAGALCEWSQRQDAKIGSLIGRADVADLPFANGRPYTISSDTVMPEVFSVFMAAYNINAGIFLPVTINGKASMYILFLVRFGNRRWTNDELKFTNDIKRILHTVLIKRITRNSLASSYSALESILENTGCGVTVNDMMHREILYSNDTFRSMFDDEEERIKIDKLVFDTANDSEVSGYYAETLDKYFNITFTNTTWVDGRTVRLATFVDITDIKTYQKQIEKQAYEDYLTGLYNRSKCGKDLSEIIRECKVFNKRSAMILVDLDDFGNINDAVGHNNGDKLLKRISTRLSEISQIRGHIYRVGGDAFSVLVTPEHIDELEIIIGILSKTFSKPWVIESKEYYCTVSMGIVKIPDDGADSESIFSRAHIALQSAKGVGKNRIEYYQQDGDAISNKRLDLENNMRKAVENDCKEFEVYYQPLVESQGGRCIGAEALVRWRSEALGFISPADFIPLAEQLGLVVPIGEHVMLEAAKRCKHWNDMGHPEYKVSINLSVIQLLQTDVVDVIRKVINATGVNPARLGFEVTESLAINDIDRMKDVLNEIKGLGCLVALDDFGTGYSSLNHIRSLPIDTIKIDKCFVDDLGDDQFSDSFVKTVTELADALNVTVCAEGVETKDQRDKVNSLNVEFIQGYYYDKPLTKEEFDNKYIFV